MIKLGVGKVKFTLIMYTFYLNMLFTCLLKLYVTGPRTIEAIEIMKKMIIGICMRN